MSDLVLRLRNGAAPLNDPNLLDEAADKLEELLRWKGIYGPRLHILEQMYRERQLDAGAGREAAATLDSERKANALLTEEVERLTAVLKNANSQAEDFEREWYLRGDRIEADETLLRQALDALMARDGDGADQWKADVINALRKRLGT